MKRSIAIALVLVLLCCGCAKAGSGPENLDGMQGSWSDMTYENSVLDITFTVPDGWQLLTQEDLQAQTEAQLEQLDETDRAITEAALQYTLNEFAALSADQAVVVQLVHEDLKGTAYMQKDQIDEQTYLELLEDKLAATMPQLTFEADEVDTVQVAGHEWHHLAMTFEDGSVREYFADKTGDFMSTLILQYSQAGQQLAQQLLDGMQAL